MHLMDLFRVCQPSTTFKYNEQWLTATGMFSYQNKAVLVRHGRYHSTPYLIALKASVSNRDILICFKHWKNVA